MWFIAVLLALLAFGLLARWKKNRNIDSMDEGEWFEEQLSDDVPMTYED